MSATIDLANPQSNGAYVVGASELDDVDAAAHEAGMRVQRISLAGCHDKDDLLQCIAAALEFPARFGDNWDALADCLGDLAWLPAATGYAWLFDHADAFRDAAEPDFDTLCDILHDACAQWGARGMPCFAFLALPEEAFDNA